jgi:hypothetical protein
MSALESGLMFICALSMLCAAIFFRTPDAPKPSLRGTFRFHPIWRQTGDFKPVGWTLWLFGLSFGSAVLVLQLLLPRAL